MVDNIIIKPEEVRIGRDSDNYNVLEGVINLSWIDSDPWIILPVPGGEDKFQHLRPNRITGKIISLDADSVYETFYNTAINAAGEFAIDPNTARHTAIDYMVIKVKTQKNEIIDYCVDCARVLTVGISPVKDEPSESGWNVTFIAKFLSRC